MTDGYEGSTIIIIIIIIVILLLFLQLELQPLVGFGLLYDFVPQSSLFTFLSPVPHFHLL